MDLISEDGPSPGMAVDPIALVMATLPSVSPEQQAQGRDAQLERPRVNAVTAAGLYETMQQANNILSLLDSVPAMKQDQISASSGVDTRSVLADA
jgi:hypothetical protein